MRMYIHIRMHMHICSYKTGVWSTSGAESAAVRLAAFELGSNMVTQCTDSLLHVTHTGTCHIYPKKKIKERQRRISIHVYIF